MQETQCREVDFAEFYSGSVSFHSRLNVSASCHDVLAAGERRLRQPVPQCMQ